MALIISKYSFPLLLPFAAGPAGLVHGEERPGGAREARHSKGQPVPSGGPPGLSLRPLLPHAVGRALSDPQAPQRKYPRYHKCLTILTKDT